ncbi:MAG: MucR family transcriptional regulator [Rhizorhabdus sp.]|nr:MucR family transcriptional regulator [Rhizorhabdus sp.]
MNITPLVASIVATYVGSHRFNPMDIPQLIEAVHGALIRLEPAAPTAPVAAASRAAQPRSNQLGATRTAPAVPIERSVTPEFLICLEDGKRFKTLKRHLREAFGMSPEEYRAKWRLPPDYPMVAPTYAKQRSEISKAVGLGSMTRKVRKQPAGQGWTVWRGQ